MEKQVRGVIAKLEFPLPECRDEFELAAHAIDIKGVLWDFDEWLRSKLKYSDDFDGQTLTAVREQLYKCMEQHNVGLYE